MGFGHRVYKSYDPRAKIIKRIADEVFEVTGKNPLLDIALELERIALEDDYFVKRKLYPNVDFYSGLIYQAMGFPVDMFPVLFAIPRTAGWLAQWEEMLTDPEQKIARPRQIYVGSARRDYVATAASAGHGAGRHRDRHRTLSPYRSRRCSPPAGWRRSCAAQPAAAAPAFSGTRALRGRAAAGAHRSARRRDARRGQGPRLHQDAARRRPASPSRSRPFDAHDAARAGPHDQPDRVIPARCRASAVAGARRHRRRRATTTPSCSRSSRSSAPTTADRARRC